MAVGMKTVKKDDTDTVILNRSCAKVLPTKTSPKRSTSSPRKMPHCKTCQRPRTGHPCSGCPYANSITPAIVRPSTPEAAKACSLSRIVSQDEQRTFLDRARLTSEGYVIILKHPTDSISDLLTGAKTVGLAAEVIGSLGENSQLVAFGRDRDIVSKLGHVGGSEKEAVDKVCENKVKKGCYLALVIGGAGAVVGAVATWTALAFS